MCFLERNFYGESCYVWSLVCVKSVSEYMLLTETEMGGVGLSVEGIHRMEESWIFYQNLLSPVGMGKKNEE